MVNAYDLVRALGELSNDAITATVIYKTKRQHFMSCVSTLGQLRTNLIVAMDFFSPLAKRPVILNMPSGVRDVLQACNARTSELRSLLQRIVNPVEKQSYMENIDKEVAEGKRLDSELQDLDKALQIVLSSCQTVLLTWLYDFHGVDKASKEEKLHVQKWLGISGTHVLGLQPLEVLMQGESRRRGALQRNREASEISNGAGPPPYEVSHP